MLLWAVQSSLPILFMSICRQSTKLSRPGKCIYNINNRKADDYHKRARPLPARGWGGAGPRRFVGMRWKCISQSFHTLHCFTPTALLFIFNYLYDIFFLILRFKYLSDSFHRRRQSTASAVFYLFSLWLFCIFNEFKLITFLMWP